MTTRLSKQERKDIVYIASGLYMKAAREIHRWHDNQDEVSYVDHKDGRWHTIKTTPNTYMTLHAKFEGSYAEGFVNKALVRTVGEKRADNLSYNNFRMLVDTTKCNLNSYVRWGIITPRGLAFEEAGFETSQELQDAMMQAL